MSYEEEDTCQANHGWSLTFPSNTFSLVSLVQFILIV